MKAFKYFYFFTFLMGSSSFKYISLAISESITFLTYFSWARICFQLFLNLHYLIAAKIARIDQTPFFRPITNGIHFHYHCGYEKKNLICEKNIVSRKLKYMFPHCLSCKIKLCFSVIIRKTFLRWPFAAKGANLLTYFKSYSDTEWFQMFRNATFFDS